MSPSTIILPSFLLNIRRDAGPEPYIVSCSMVGQTDGFCGIVRRFQSKEQFAAHLDALGIPTDRYSSALSTVDVGKTESFGISLNEAQRLSIIFTDTTE